MPGSRALFRALALCLAAPMAACIDSSLAGADQSTADGFEGGDSGGASSGDASDGADGADSGPELDPALWWRLAATVAVVDGRASPTGSLLEVVSLDANAVVRCTAAAPVERVTSLTPPEAEIIAWWQLIVGEWTGDCVDAGESIPVEVIQLGVGTLHPEILAVLERVPGAEPGSDMSLNGAYARLETGGPVYVFGAAGLDSAFLGEGERAVEAPLADGSWRVEPVYAFNGADGW